MVVLQHNKRNREIVIQGLTDEDVLDIPAIPRLKFSWKNHELRVTYVGSNTLAVFKKTAIIIPICWKPNVRPTSTMICCSKQLAIYEVRQGTHVGYTFAIKQKELT